MMREQWNRFKTRCGSVPWGAFIVGYQVGFFLALMSIQIGERLHDKRGPVRPAPPVYPNDY